VRKERDVSVDAAIRLYEALITRDAGVAIEMIEEAKALGSTDDQVFDELYAPALACLGGAWATGGIDEATFARSAVIADQIAPFVVPSAVPRDRGVGVVIGTAKGDRHSVLKNIVASVLSEDGYRVSDLGVGVPTWEFLAAIEQTGARMAIVCVESAPAILGVQHLRTRLDRRGRNEVIVLAAGGLFVAEPARARNAGAHGVITSAAGALTVLARVTEDLLTPRDGAR
jgi:methanogenic corrinoid protein MtbC1